MLNAHNITIEINNLTVCRELNFSLKAGDFLGILGPNGSGKTTLLHALANLYSLKNGSIHFLGQKLSEYASTQLAQQVGILFQHFQGSFLETVYEFCLAGRHPHIKKFGWESEQDKIIVLDSLEHMDLLSKLNQTVSTLSGGEQRRLLIATLLTQDPQLYLADEPINHLDIHHQIKVLNHFKKLSLEHKTVVMSLHDINFTQYYCTHVLMLFSDGRTLLGAPSEILTQENLTELYSHPVKLLETKAERCWIPEFN